MKKSNLVLLTVVFCGFCLLAGGCGRRDVAPGVPPAAAAPDEVYVDSAPPPLLVETVPPIPGDGFIWIGGNWFWEGGRWQWRGGYWARPPHPGAAWVGPRYEYRDGHHVYSRGRWR